MRLAGLQLAPSAVASLARLLELAGHHELATHFGFAIDRGYKEVGLSRADRHYIADALETACPKNLEALRRALADDPASAHRRAS